MDISLLSFLVRKADAWSKASARQLWQSGESAIELEQGGIEGFKYAPSELVLSKEVISDYTLWAWTISDLRYQRSSLV